MSTPLDVNLNGGVQKWKRYPAYQETGVKWVPSVPQHWKALKIKRLCLVKRGASPRPIDDPIYFDESGEYAWVRISDVTASERYLLTTEQRLSAIGQSRSVPLGPGELFLSIAATVGKPIITQVKCCIHDGFVYFVGLKEDREYLYYLFSCGEAYKGLGKHGTQLNLNTDTIGDLKIPLPPLDEQHRIVAFLDREAAKIDSLIAKKERLIELLQEKRTALISHAVTKGLDRTVPMKDSCVEWLGKIPAHWDIIQSRRVFKVRNEPAWEADEQLTASQKYGMLPQTEFMELEGRRVVVTIKGVESLRHVEPNDFVISLRSFQGGIEWCKLRGSVTFHYVVLKSVKPIHPAYFGQLFKSSVFIQALRATTDFIRDGQDLRYSHFILVPLPVVPMDEQAAIAEFLERETSKFDSLVNVAQKTIDLLREYRIALVSAAVTGKIDVREEVA